MEVRNFLNASIPADNVSQDLLIHARLFVFADKWLISALSELAFHKLHRDICEYNIVEDEGAEIVELLKYCFAPTNSGGDVENKNEVNEDDTLEELKELVFAYAACKSEQLLRYTQFRRLLQQNGRYGAAIHRCCQLSVLLSIDGLAELELNSPRTLQCYCLG